MNKTRPVRPKQGDTVKASHMVNHAQAIEELQNQVDVSQKIQNRQFKYKHPFKIYVEKAGSEIRLSVNYGRQYRNWIKSTNAALSSVDSDTQDLDISFDTSQNLRNHPDGLTAGYSVLSVSTTYGIWARGAYSKIYSSTDFFGTGDGNGRGYMKTDTWALTFLDVSPDNLNTTPDAYDGTGTADLFIGSVAVDSNGVWTIKQYWRSDIICPCFVMPYIDVSSTSGNSFSLAASDGLPFVPPIVSSDANNSISEGADGGAFYDAP